MPPKEPTASNVEGGEQAVGVAQTNLVDRLDRDELGDFDNRVQVVLRAVDRIKLYPRYLLIHLFSGFGRIECDCEYRRIFSSHFPASPPSPSTKPLDISFWRAAAASAADFWSSSRTHESHCLGPTDAILSKDCWLNMNLRCSGSSVAPENQLSKSKSSCLYSTPSNEGCRASLASTKAISGARTSSVMASFGATNGSGEVST